jgi:lysyl-tRNA synthetase class 2
MADKQPPADTPAGESAENLHKDPVTGEMISKSELKRRTKQRDRDEKKKEKGPAVPAHPKKEGKKEDAEELNPNVCTRNHNGIHHC